MTFDAVRPVIVPTEYFERADFPAAHENLVAPDLARTWVELTECQTMVYVTRERAMAWDCAGVAWRTAAVSSMRNADRGAVYTHEKRTARGDLAWVAMMHEDGLGSSRLLCRAELADVFPEGYWIALPDRSCGIAISRSLRGEALDEVRAMVSSMHRNATVPMLPDLRDPDMLLPHAV